MANDDDIAEPMVAMLQVRTPVKMTFRGPTRSAIGPEISDDSAKTPRFTSDSRPSRNFDRPNASARNGVML